MATLNSLTEITAPSGEDFVYTEDNPADPTAKKVRQRNLGVYRYIHFQILGTLTTGDGQAWATVPSDLDGYNLVDIEGDLGTQSSSGAPSFQLHNETQAADMLSVNLTIDANEDNSSTAATPPTIDTGNDDVAALDRLRLDVDGAGTGAADPDIIGVFERP